jgi:hypothetical protein
MDRASQINPTEDGITDAKYSWHFVMLLATSKSRSVTEFPYLANAIDHIHNSHGVRWWSTKIPNEYSWYNLLFVLANESWQQQQPVLLILPKESSNVHCALHVVPTWLTCMDHIDT